MAAHVGVIRVEGRRHGDQAEQVEPQQDPGGNPTGPHCPLASVLGETERHSEEQDFTFKRLRCYVHESDKSRAKTTITLKQKNTAIRVRTNHNAGIEA